MTHDAWKTSRRLCLLTIIAALVTAGPILSNPEPALGGSFPVTACDAASPPTASSSWIPQPGSVDVYKACPTSTLAAGFGGMGTRLAGRTFRNGEFSRLWIYAPPGTTITGLTWAGGFTHNCGSRWANQLRAQGRVDQVLVGTHAELPLWVCPVPREYGLTWLSVPAGTTRLLQNTQCAQATCESGAAFRTRSAAVVINDPTPPALAITGGGLSGAKGWVRGRQDLTVSASDVTGVKLVRTQIAGYEGPIDRPKPCNYTTTTPCVAGNGATTLDAHTTLLSDGPHAVTVTAVDAAGNATSRGATVKVDNAVPPAPEASLDGGSDWRASNAFTLRWATPEGASATRAPVVAVRYRVCPAGSQSGCTRERTVSESGPTDVNPKAPGEGEFDAYVALVDAAGNGAGAEANWSEPVRLRYDPDVAQLRVGIVTVKLKRVKVRGKRRAVRRRVVRLRRSKRVRHGRRFEVRGLLLTRSGQPRVNTPVAIYGRADRLGAGESYLGSVRTDTGGRFSYRAEARQSHTLRFTRRASTGTVKIRVPARLTFRAAPRSVLNGEAVTFRGRVFGEIPPGGKQVVIQAHSRGKWRTFRLLRTGARGHYRDVYRFDGTSGTVPVPLRAVTTKEATFPYEPGRSKVRRVTVRGL